MTTGRTMTLPILLMLALAPAYGENPMSLSPPVQPPSVNASLYEIGREIDCYFTVEIRAKQTRDGHMPFVHRNIALDEEARIDSIDTLVKTLRDKLDGVKVVRNERRPSVIHLIDERLLEDEDYPLEKRVTISYSGILGNLADAIGEQGLSIEVRRWGSGPTDMFGDHVTKVDVEAEDRLVRDVLTLAAPREGYSRILWHATTWKTKKAKKTRDGLLTGIKYYGPYTPPPLWYEEVRVFDLDAEGDGKRRVVIREDDQIRRLMSFFPRMNEGVIPVTEADWKPAVRFEFYYRKNGDKHATVVVNASMTRWSDTLDIGDGPLKPEFREYFEKLFERDEGVE